MANGTCLVSRRRNPSQVRILCPAPVTLLRLARLSHLVWGEDIAGSNPAAETKYGSVAAYLIFMHICKYCSREFKNAGGLGSHEPYCKLNPNRVQRKISPNAHKKKGTPPWNKGLINDVRCKHPPGFRTGSSGRASSPELELERIAKIKEKAKLTNGAYRHGSGRGKKGWYKGIFCDSSWELAYLLYVLDNNFSISKNKDFREYEYDGKIRKYLPDFVVNGKLVEIKGFKTEQWIAKHEANPDIEVLYYDEMKPILTYVIDRYGSDFIKLYEEGRCFGS